MIGCTLKSKQVPAQRWRTTVYVLSHWINYESLSCHDSHSVMMIKNTYADDADDKQW